MQEHDGGGVDRFAFMPLVLEAAPVDGEVSHAVPLPAGFAIDSKSSVDERPVLGG